MNEQNDLVLVYFNCRGLAHTLRMLLYEIGVPFQEAKIDFNGTIPEHLRKHSITLCMIPCIVHGEVVAAPLFPAIKYLCNRYNRMDLLGRDLVSQTQLTEVMTRYMKQKCAGLTIIFRAVNIFTKNPERMKEIKEKCLNEMTQEITWPQACVKLYADSGTFLFHHLTVLDFIFYEHCFYFQNFLSDIAPKKKYPAYFAFKNFFEKTDFYQTNIEKIESFPCVMPEFNAQINEGLKHMWVGDARFLQNS